MKIKVKTIRSRRRTIALEVTSDGALIIRAPLRAGDSVLNKFINDKKTWIQKTRAKILKRANETAARGPLKASIIAHYKSEAAHIIPERVKLFAQAYSLTPTKVVISNARKRWGSCSPTGRLSFTWRLAMAPLPVIDYVVAHELAHLVQTNHSKKFWAVVERMIPDWRAQRAWLREHGHLLTD